MAWHMTLPYWLTVAAAVASGFAAVALPAIPPHAHPVPAVRLGRLATLRRVFADSPLVPFAMIQGVAIFVMVRLLQVNLFQPILEAKAFDVGSFGIVLSVLSIFEAIGAARPGWMRHWLSDLNAVSALTVVMAITVALLPPAGKTLSLVWLGVFAYLTGLSFPIQRQLLNDLIVDSRYRATMLSIESIVDRSVCAGIAPIIGTFLGEGRLNAFLYQSAVWAIGLMGFLWLGLALARSKIKGVSL
jgi:hypothetical protein